MRIKYQHMNMQICNAHEIDLITCLLARNLNAFYKASSAFAFEFCEESKHMARLKLLNHSRAPLSLHFHRSFVQNSLFFRANLLKNN